MSYSVEEGIHIKHTGNLRCAYLVETHKEEYNACSVKTNDGTGVWRSIFKERYAGNEYEVKRTVSYMIRAMYCQF